MQLRFSIAIDFIRNGDKKCHFLPLFLPPFLVKGKWRNSGQLRGSFVLLGKKWKRKIIFRVNNRAIIGKGNGGEILATASLPQRLLSKLSRWSVAVWQTDPFTQFTRQTAACSLANFQISASRRSLCIRVVGLRSPGIFRCFEGNKILSLSLSLCLSLRC